MVRRYDIKVIISIVLIVIAALSLLTFGGWVIYTKTTWLSKAPVIGIEKQQEKVLVKNVSSDTVKRLSEGSVLTFGDPDKTAVTLLVDPSELSRSTKLIDGEPSDFLNAVKDNKIFLNLYLIPSSDDRVTGTNSLIRAATCNLSTDKSPGAIITLVKLVNAADKFVGNEDVNKASEIMNMEKDAKCPDTVDESSAGTADNAKFFAQHFGIDHPSALISDGQLINNLNKFKSDWVKDLIAGKPATQLLDNSVELDIKE